MISLIDKMKPYSDVTNMFELNNPTQEEFWMLWLGEAILHGYILDYTPEAEMEAFLLFDGLYYEYLDEYIVYQGTVREETRQRTKKERLLAPTRYTPDGVIIWNPKVKDILFNEVFTKGDAFFKAQFIDNKWVSVLDVKAPTGTNRSSDTPFSFTRKWLWQRYHLYVNKVMCIPPKPSDKGYLYKDVWTPARYLMSNKLVKLRTIHYPVKVVAEFQEEFKI